jgi:hypothetical protein
MPLQRIATQTASFEGVSAHRGSRRFWTASLAFVCIFDVRDFAETRPERVHRLDNRRKFDWSV